MSTPDVAELDAVMAALREWPRDGAGVQLHVGDLGWHWRFGSAAVVAAVRAWSRDGRFLAVGMLDSPELLRLAMAPEAEHDEELALRIVADVTRPERGVLPAGKASVEARFDGLFPGLLVDASWVDDEPWTPIRRDLTDPVVECGLRIEVTGAEGVEVRSAVQRAAFPSSTFTVERWHAMAAGPAYADARCLVGYDDRGTAVAAATVWSSGPGRPGLLEPLGTHREHRGHGYGTAITLAAAASLRELGSSSMFVCTPASNVGAVATYVSAGMERLPDAHDLRRGA